MWGDGAEILGISEMYEDRRVIKFCLTVTLE
jgi:hypothetical protein